MKTEQYDYDACRVVAALSEIFAPHCKWWQISRGLQVERYYSPRHSPYLRFVIHPWGWMNSVPDRKQDLIEVRFLQEQGYWHPVDGTIIFAKECRLPHSDSKEFSFKILSWSSRRIVIGGNGEAEVAFFENRTQSPEPTTDAD